jgi:hypothetical protein
LKCVYREIVRYALRHAGQADYDTRDISPRSIVYAKVGRIARDIAGRADRAQRSRTVEGSICTLNCPGPSAWIKAPAPVSVAAKFNVKGPTPPFPLSEVQIRLSPALKPAPVQLQGVTLHLTATTPSLAASAPVIPRLFVEVALKLAGINA